MSDRGHMYTVHIPRHKRASEPLSWACILAASIAGGIVVGVLVYFLVPLRWSAEAKILSNTGVSGNAALLDMAAQATGADTGSVGLTATRLQTILESRRIRKEVAATTQLAIALGIAEDDAIASVEGLASIRSAPGGALTLEATCTGPSRLADRRQSRSGLSTDAARRLCADVVNAHITALRGYLEVQSRQQAKFIRARRNEAATNLKRIDDQLEAFAASHGMLNATGQADLVGSQIRAAVQAQAQAQADQLAAARALTVARHSLTEQEVMRVQTATTARNPVVASLSQALADDEVALASALASGMKSSHPDVVAMRDRISAIQSRLHGVAAEIQTQVTREVNPAHDEMLRQVVNGEVEQARSKALVLSYGAQLAAANRQIADLPPLVRRYSELEMQHDTQAEVLRTLAKRLEMAIIDEKREATDKFEVLDLAEPPVHKSGPSTTRSAAVATMLILITLGFISLRQRGLLGMLTDPDRSETTPVSVEQSE